MKLITAFFLFIFSFLTCAQHGPGGPDSPGRVVPRASADLMALPASDSTRFISVFVRLPYNALVFTQQSGKFSASFVVEANAADSLGRHLAREFWQSSVTVTSFEDTHDPRFTAEGLISFTAPKTAFSVRLLLRDANAAEEREIRELPVAASGLPQKVYKSIITFQNRFACGADSVLRLFDFESNMPFSPVAYDLYIPVADAAAKSVSVVFTGREDTVSFTSVASVDSAFSITPCGNKVVFTPGSGVPCRLFKISGANLRLREGVYEMKVLAAGNTPPLYSSRVVSRWLNRPVSLFDPELAYRVLGIIYSPQAADSLFKLYKKDAVPGLFKIWQPLDPTPNTTFNELMAEFYTRVDFALENYSTLKGRDGADTDRGKVYIKLGKPGSVSRGTAANNRITEVWLYPQFGKEFTFVENGGTGNFILQSVK